VIAVSLPLALAAVLMQRVDDRRAAAEGADVAAVA
jgi:hypothetical protein